MKEKRTWRMGGGLNVVGRPQGGGERGGRDRMKKCRITHLIHVWSHKTVVGTEEWDVSSQMECRRFWLPWGSRRRRVSPTFVFASCFAAIDWLVCARARVRAWVPVTWWSALSGDEPIDRGNGNWGVSFFFCLPCDLSVNVAECSEWRLVEIGRERKIGGHPFSLSDAQRAS